MTNKKYTYSNRAALDVKKIYKDTVKNWDQTQADKYDQGLLKTIQLLASHPDIGQKCEEIKPNLMRFKYESHIIFYRKRENDIFITRILHSRMDYERHL